MNPRMICVDMTRNAVVVLCCGWNPCGWSAIGWLPLMLGIIKESSLWAIKTKWVCMTCICWHPSLASVAGPPCPHSMLRKLCEWLTTGWGLLGFKFGIFSTGRGARKLVDQDTSSSDQSRLLAKSEVLSSFIPGFEGTSTVTHRSLTSVPIVQHFRWSSYFFLLCSCTIRMSSTVNSLILGSLGLERRASSRSFASPVASAGKFGIISGIRPQSTIGNNLLHLWCLGKSLVLPEHQNVVAVLWSERWWSFWIVACEFPLGRNATTYGEH